MNPNKQQRPEEFSTVTREYITVLLDKAHLDKRDILRARIAELQTELDGQVWRVDDPAYPGEMGNTLPGSTPSEHDET